MARLGFFHNVHDNLEATEFAIKSVREHYPDAFYMLIGDGGVDHFELAKKYNCDYYYNNNNLGYGEFEKSSVLETLKRVLFACLKSNSTHLMMMEDDVVVLDQIVFDENSHCIGQPIGVHNKMPQQLLDYAESMSGIKPETDYYCFGGGSILNVQTYLQNFGRVYPLFDMNIDNIKNGYPQMGWLDCFLTYFFYLSGSKIDLHTGLYTVAPWPRDVRNFDLDLVRGKYQLVDRFKNYYK